MEEEKIEIKKRKIQRVLYYIYCKKCHKEITGHDETTAKRNWGYHLESHKHKDINPKKDEWE